jgi:hypothetical protein
MEGSSPAPASPEPEPTANPNPSLAGVLPEVAKGLKDRPALLFGIGAGVVLVLVLGITTDLWLVLVVAAVLLLCLAAWVLTDARRRLQGDEAGIRNVARAKGAKVKKSDVGVVDPDVASVENVTDVRGAEITDSNVGVVGRRRRPRS